MGNLTTYQTWKENGSLTDDVGNSDITKEPKTEVEVTDSSITDADLILASTLPAQASNSVQSKNRQSHQLQPKHYRELMIDQTVHPVQ